MGERERVRKGNKIKRSIEKTKGQAGEGIRRNETVLFFHFSLSACLLLAVLWRESKAEDHVRRIWRTSLGVHVTQTPPPTYKNETR